MEVLNIKKRENSNLHINYGLSLQLKKTYTTHNVSWLFYNYIETINTIV